MQTALARFAFLLLIWGSTASGLVASGLINRPTQPQVLPVLIMISVIVTSAVFLRSRAVDAHLRALGLRLILALHAIRLVGGFFIWAHQHGHLPAAFAYSAGLGDIATAIGALVLLQLPDGTSFRRALLV